MTCRLLVGDVFDRMAELADGTIDLVLTSPPFLALRSYLPADHPDKAKEIGSEPTPAAFIDTLLRLTAEWRRLLAPHGSICVELGDTYSGSGGAGGDYGPDGMREGQPTFDGSQRRTRTNNLYNTANRYSDEWNKGNTAGKPIEGVPIAGGDGWPLAKSLALVPELYRVALAYGLNPLTGQPSPAGRWRVRNVVRWCRPNPPVGALGDKFRPATTDLVIACTARDRWFDLDAVREPAKHPNATHTVGRVADTRGDYGDPSKAIENHPAGAPPLDYWEIPTHPYRGAHYATWPKALCVTPILAMCPQRVCVTCGEPSRRIVGEPTYEPSASYRGGSTLADSERVAEGVNQWVGAAGASASLVRTVETLGWSDCGHNTWRPGHVLDPFAGSGTTLAVCTGLARDSTGIDLDPRNAHLAAERIGMFLEVAT